MKYDLNNESRWKPCLSSDTSYIRYGISVIRERVVRKEAYASSLFGLQSIEMVCQYFIRNPDPLVVPVYDFQHINYHENGFAAHQYHYDMMRMTTLDSEEKELIRNICNRYHYTRDFSKQEKQAYFNNLRSCNDKRDSLISFMEEVLNLGRYGDLHNGNFMKDEDDNYRAIDLEGFVVHSPLEDSRNDWFRS